jgi:hypothetical protein
VTFSQFPYQFRFSNDELQPLAPELLAGQMCVSRGFIQLCFDTGCPNGGHATSAANLLNWLSDHYEDVRALAGLRVLAPIADLQSSTVKWLRMANALTTLLEYGRTRATDWRQKRHFRAVLEQLDRMADRAA